MTRILAAIDNSLATTPVLGLAGRLAGFFGGDVDAVHVRVDGHDVVVSAAAAAGLEARVLSGPVAETLARETEAEDVAAMVVGSRGLPHSRRRVGQTAFAILETVEKPVAVVPPEASVERLQRVLVPLEGSESTSLAPRRMIELAQGAELDVVVLHVHDESSLPAFTDQPQHETAAWSDEFLARYCPWGIRDVRFESRVGRPDEQVLRTVDETGADLIALGWSRALAGGRGPVVRALLERGRVPILLIPVQRVDRAVTDRALASASPS
ncbi:MAG TPA: universal stress protein [Gaiellaceae bacterium]|nr:universal stress protein [Gaiellaceae bacterium]